jgi:hypothetical protein
MFRCGPRLAITSVRAHTILLTILMIGAALFASPESAFAQHGGGGGGGHGMSGGGGTGGGGRPDGVADKDDLKDFHRALALQATPDQRSAFAKIAQYTQSAGDQLQGFRESLQKRGAAPSPSSPADSSISSSASSSVSDRIGALDMAFSQARAGSQNFLTSLSAAQKSGLKDITNKLAKADSELEKQTKILDQIVKTTKLDNQQLANTSANLEKELANFQSEQLALGREMGILLTSDSQELTFNFPRAVNSIKVDGQLVSVPASGSATRTSVENGRNTFKLELVADLSDLQQNLSVILRSELARSPRCGERIEVQQATLTPLVPASLVVTRLHFERWVCAPGQGPVEMASGDATFEVKFTPSVDPKTGLGLVSEINHVDATGFLRDLLRSGDLGASLRDQIASVLLSTIQKTADLKAVLPAAAQEPMPLQRAQFADAGADQLSLVIDGQLPLSDEETKQFGIQLKQRLSAGAASPQ